MPTRDELLDGLRGGLIVSCQAYPGEPLHGPVHMTAMARTVVAAGAAGVRINGPDDVRAVRAAVDVPLIGLWKDGDDGVYITPTLRHALTVASCGADIVALDATGRARGDGRDLAATVGEFHRRTGALVMADVATFDEGVRAAEAGADIVGTTLSGYTGRAARPEGPDLDLVEALAARLPVPVFAEGRIATPAHAATALERGAWSVVVGGAITRPGQITAGFTGALSSRGSRRAGG